MIGNIYELPESITFLLICRESHGMLSARQFNLYYPADPYLNDIIALEIKATGLVDILKYFKQKIPPILDWDIKKHYSPIIST